MPADVFDQAAGQAQAEQGDAFDQVANPPPPQEQKPQGDYLTKTEDFIHGASAGAAEEAWGMAKAALKPFDVAQSVAEDVPAEFQAYEDSRKQGKGMVDSAKDALGVVAQKHNALATLEQRFEEFKTNPSHATGKLIVDLMPLALGLGAKGGAAEAGETEAAAAPKAGIIKQIVKGKNVAQPEAQAAMGEAGAGGESIRESLTQPIAEAESKADALYKQMDESGIDVKAMNQKLRNINRELRKLTDTPEDMAREAKLEQARTGLMDKIQQSGIPPKLIKQADAQFRQAQALSDVEAKIFKNPEIVEGNVKYGTEETVNVDKAIKSLEKLQENKWGRRVDQAFGKEGADRLMSKLYDAQRQGVHAMKVREIAKWAGITLGASGGAVGVLSKLSGGQ